MQCLISLRLPVSKLQLKEFLIYPPVRHLCLFNRSDFFYYSKVIKKMVNMHLLIFVLFRVFGSGERQWTASLPTVNQSKYLSSIPKDSEPQTRSRTMMSESFHSRSYLHLISFTTASNPSMRRNLTTFLLSSILLRTSKSRLVEATTKLTPKIMHSTSQH